ncbi:MAG: hypothetical protein NT005_08410, partial [Spirochaetes bacterium]|nr:hypothetical protein [Spirochaetota bacterium]
MRAKRRAAALVLGALLGAAAACRAQGVALTVKVFPQNAALTVDEMLVDAKARPDTQPRVLTLSAGDHAIRLTAAGYQPKDLAVSLSSPLTIEVKLEREGSRLAKRSEMPTGREPKSVAFTPDGRFILCALLEGEGVEAIPTDGTPGRLALAPPAPWAAKKGFVEMAFLAGRQELWVTQMTTGMVHVFSLSDFAWRASFPTGGSWSKFILASPDEKTAYVSNWESRDVSVIDTASDRLLAQIPVDRNLNTIALTPDGRHLFVSSRGPNNPEDYTKKGPAF